MHRAQSRRLGDTSERVRKKSAARRGAPARWAKRKARRCANRWAAESIAREKQKPCGKTLRVRKGTQFLLRCGAKKARFATDAIFRDSPISLRLHQNAV